MASPRLQQQATETLPPAAFNLQLLSLDGDAQQEYRGVASAAGFDVIDQQLQELWQALELDPPDAVLLDLRLSEPLLLDVLREIKARNANIEVILVSACASVAGAVQALREGAFDYLEAPIDSDELRAAMEHLSLHLHVKLQERIIRNDRRTKHGYGTIGRSALENRAVDAVVTTLRKRPPVAPARKAPRVESPAASSNPPAPDQPNIVSLAEIEKQAILCAISVLHGDKLLAARLLGVGKTTLYRKLKEYDRNGTAK
jgi:DNA-binding NtrC family response regulator